MLMPELMTAVANSLPVKIILLMHNSLAEVKFEQQELGNPEYGSALPPIDFVAVAKTCGADGFSLPAPGGSSPGYSCGAQFAECRAGRSRGRCQRETDQVQ
jgi:thiamine pyrophosphate-dependent acetolactate synthase large subunit-like protein